MKLTIILLSLLLLLGSCNSAKRSRQFLAEGNYGGAIALSVKKLVKNKSGKKSGELIAILEDAFKKVVEEDTRRISSLKTENTPEAIRQVHYLYTTMESRQQLIRPLLPLYSTTLGRDAVFNIVDYTAATKAAKEGFANSLHEQGEGYLANYTVMDARRAYENFAELKKLQSNYPNIDKLLREARQKGTRYVTVGLQNSTQQIIPARLEEELLDFSTYGLDDFWTEFHAKWKDGVAYSYAINLNFKQIDISPERIIEKSHKRKKRINDGWEYRYDRNGNVLKDSLGNDIKVPVYKNVTARITHTTQRKTVLMGGDVIYNDVPGNEYIDKYPLVTEFIFENAFAKYRGDKRALNAEDLELIKNDAVPFPTNEQMVYDAGTDLKNRLKNILKQHPFQE